MGKKRDKKEKTYQNEDREYPWDYDLNDRTRSEKTPRRKNKREEIYDFIPLELKARFENRNP